VNRKILFVLLALIFNVALKSSAQGTAFSYQGRLNDGGAPANANYNFRFSLYNALTSGSLVAGPKTNSAVLVTNGLFLVTLDFGAGIFTGTNYWLEIGVCAANSNSFVTLAPRQPLLPVPYAIFANGASNLLGTLSATQLVGSIPSAQLAGNYSGAVNFANSANTFSGAFSGDGSSLSNLNGSQISSGTVADVRLSPNVALLNASQTFSGNNIFNGNQTFNGANNFTNLQNSFSGSFFGNGLVGWIPVSGTSTQAMSDAGYLLLNSNLTTVTLPASPNISDIVRISGAGLGGWRVMQNSGQSIFGNFITYSNSLWLPASVMPERWNDLAASADGVKMYAAASSGTTSQGMFTSDNSGMTWSQAAVNAGFNSVATSADGTVVFGAPDSSAQLYVSIDSGTTFSPVATSRNWISIACSASGLRALAAVPNVGIFTNSGSTWNISSAPTSANWIAVASSASGTNLAAAAYGGFIYTSANAGYTWTHTSISANWIALVSSADGQKLAAAIKGGGIYTSINAGGSWTATTAPSLNWSCLAGSADCTRLAAGISNGVIYTSENLGAIWSPTANMTNQVWSAIVSSANGSKLAAAVFPPGGGSGPIYYSSAAAQTSSTVGTSGFISGSQGSAVELQYIGNNQFMPVSSVGLIWSN
jgi:hypothetical protein